MECGVSGSVEGARLLPFTRLAREARQSLPRVDWLAPVNRSLGAAIFFFLLRPSK